MGLEIYSDEISWVSIVCVYAADLRGGEDDVLRFLVGEEGFDGGLVSEIEIGMCTEDEICAA